MKISTKICIKNDKKRLAYCEKYIKMGSLFGYEFSMRQQRDAAGNCFPTGVSFGLWVYDMIMR